LSHIIKVYLLIIITGVQMQLAKQYHTKLVNIKKEMHALHEKSAQLKVCSVQLCYIIIIIIIINIMFAVFRKKVVCFVFEHNFTSTVSVFSYNFQ